MEKIFLTIDDKEIVTEEGTTVLEASLANGITIPTFCWLKKLNPIGSCRVCLVEIDGVADPMASCQLPVIDGMVVTTQSEKLTELRKTMIKLLLVNHPLDCPVCERSGECQLQNFTRETQITDQQYRTQSVKRTNHLSDWGLIRYQAGLCVLCERCVKVCHQVQGVGSYRIVNNGYGTVIDTKDGKPLNCTFCGQCISVCPVGALNSGLRFSARSWELEKTDTICGYCGVGCSLSIDSKNGKMVRVSTDDSKGINGGNLCAKGRFGYQFADNENRLKGPLIRRGHRLEPVSWDDALELVASKLKEIHDRKGGEYIAGIGSPRCSNEDNYLLQKFLRSLLDSGNVDNMENIKSREFGGSVFDTFADVPVQDSQVIKDADLLLAFGVDLREENSVIGNMVRKAIRENDVPLITMNSRGVKYKPLPERQIQFNYGSEIALVNGLLKSLVGPESEFADTANSKEFKEYLGEIDNGKIAADTGVSDNEIKAIAEMLKNSKSVLILTGSGVYKHPRGVDIQHAIQNLAKVTGGKTLLYREYCNSQGVNDMGVVPDRLPGYQKVSDASVKERYQELWGKLPEEKSKENIIERCAESEIRLLIVMGEDIVRSYPNGERAKQCIDNVDFVVAMDMFPNETVSMADVVLPITSFAESESTVTNMEGRVQRVRKAIDRIGESRPAWEILNELSSRLKTPLRYETSHQVLDDIRKETPLYKDVDDDSLENGGKTLEYTKKAGPFEFALVDSSGPYKGDGEHPLVLNFGNSFFHLAPFSGLSEGLRKLTPHCFVEINPADAVACGVADGDRANIESGGKKVPVRIKVTEKSPEGVAFLPQVFDDVPLNTIQSGSDAIIKVKISARE